MPAKNVSLSPRLARFIDQQIESGRHRDASDVVREALLRYEADLEDDDTRTETMRAIVAEGRADIARGAYTLITDESADDFLKQLNDESRRSVPGDCSSGYLFCSLGVCSM